MRILQLTERLQTEAARLNREMTRPEIQDLFLSSLELRELSYSFKNPKLLLEAFTHKSFINETSALSGHYERFEFLGDSVLSLVITQALLTRYSDLDEGQLSKLRSTIVNEDTLASFAKFAGMQNFIIMGRGEFASEGHYRSSILSDIFEAYLGAVFLDSDFVTVKGVLLDFIHCYETQMQIVFLEDLSELTDFRTLCQQLCHQKFGATPTYHSKELDGIFHVELKIKNKLLAKASGESKKQAIFAAAQIAVQVLKE